MLISYIRIALG